MNSRSANSGDSAGPIEPPAPAEVFVVLPNGSCIPATMDKLRIVMRQVRSTATKQRRLAAKEKADELQRNLEDRAAAWRYLQELAEIDRDRQRMAATLRVRVKPHRPARSTSDVVKRSAVPISRKPISMTIVLSSWVIDDFGMRGVHYNQSYIGRKSPKFYRGAARDRWEYEARDEAVLRDVAGEPIIIANIGDDIDEIGAAWQAIEDATTRLNGKIQIRIIVALDADASKAENVAALKHFCQSVLEPLGLPYSAVIHRAPDNGDERNIHGHVLTNFRPTERVEPYCWSFADHVRGELDGRDGVQMLRHLWAHSMSQAAEQAQRDMRYTGLGYGARGLDLEPGEHLHEARSAMVRRGQTVWAHERNRIKQARNAARRAVRDADKKIEALVRLRDAAVAQIEAGKAENMRAPLKLKLAHAVHAATPPASMPSSRVQAGPATGCERLIATSGAAAILTTPSPEPLAVPVNTGRSSPLGVAERSEAPLRALVTSTEVKQPVFLRPSGCEPDAASLTTAAAKHPVDKSPLRASTEKRTPRTKPFGVEYASVLTDRKQVTRRVDQSVIPASRLNWPPPVRPLSTLPPSRDTSLCPSLRADPVPMLECAPSSKPPAMQLALWTKPDDRGTIAGRMRGVFAAIARWRQADPGISVAAPHAIPPKRAEATAARQDNAGHEAGIPTPAITSAAAYWRRKRLAEDMGASRRGAVNVIPDREWLEDHPRTEFDERALRAIEQDERLIDRLRKADVYVGDYGVGTLELDPRVVDTLKVGGDWLLKAHVQRALCEIRAEQQQVVEALRAETEARPLAFSRTGLRFWPNDLAPELKQRLDRWARDECFGNDMFAIETYVRHAHRVNDAEPDRRGGSTVVKPEVERNPAAARRKAKQPSSHNHEGLRILAFDKTTGSPTRSLLMLIRYAGEHPNRIDLDATGPQVVEGVPETIRSLAEQWKGDARVRLLVEATVAMSRAAGRPSWPPELSYEMRAIVRNSPAPPWSMNELPLSR